MLSSINKTAALAVIGILFASISQSVCLAEVPTQKSYLRSVSKGTRALNDRGEPDAPQREISIEELDDQTKGGVIAIAAEAEYIAPTKEPIDSVPQIEPGAPTDDKNNADDVQVGAQATLKPTEESIDSVPQVAEGAPTDDKNNADDVEVGAEAPLKPTKPDTVVDSATFVIRGHPDKSCAWLSLKRVGATKKWCQSKAFKKNKKGDKPKVYEYCRETCCSAGISHACEEVVL